MVDWDDFYDSTLLTSAAQSRPRDVDEGIATQRRVVALLGGVHHEHVVPVVGSLLVGSQVKVEHGLPPGARPAREWMPVDGGLSAGEVVTVGVALARGLAALHRAGVSGDGALRIDDVVIDADGRPAWQVSRAVMRDRQSEADDVAALGQMLRDLLADGVAPGALTLALLRAMDDDPSRRSSASSLADSLVASCAPVALAWPPRTAESVRRSDEPEPVSSEPVAASRRASTIPGVRDARGRSGGGSGGRVGGEVRGGSGAPVRRVPWRVLAVLAVALIGMLGMVRGASGGSVASDKQLAPAAKEESAVTPEPSPTPVPSLAATVMDETDQPEPTTAAPSPTTPTPAPAALRAPDPPWVSVLGALDAARIRAFSTGDAAALSRADAAGSSALAADQAALRTMTAVGLRPRGYTTRIVEAAEVARTGGSVVVRVIDEVRAYDLVDSSGVVRERRAARGRMSWLVTLVPVTGGTPEALDAEGQWRVASIEFLPPVGVTASG